MKITSEKYKQENFTHNVESVQDSIRKTIETAINGNHFNVSTSVGFYGLFFSKDTVSNQGFASCHDIISGSVDITGKSIPFLYLFLGQNEKNNSNNIHSNISKTKWFVEGLPNLFEQLSKYTGIKTIPDVTIIEGNLFNIVKLDFTNALEWITSRTQRYMILKLFRSYILGFEKSPRNLSEIMDNIVNKSNFPEIKLIFKYYSKFKETRHRLFIHDYTTLENESFKYKKEEESITQKKASLKVWSRHPSHAPLRGMAITHPTIVRFGYRVIEKAGQEETAQKTNIIINPFNGIENSASKFRMKYCFSENNVKTADFVIPNEIEDIEDFVSNYDEKTKFIVKSEFGSRGQGLLLFENKDELIKWFETPFAKIKKQKYTNYLIERYYPYTREYRLHVTAEGCFYTCRKMLKEDSKERWYRNDSNSVWIVEENEMFQKPTNWKIIEEECVKALNSVGLDIGACDVRVQSARNQKNELRKNIDFIICEINSAPGLGEIGLEKYKEIIHQIIKQKTT